MNRKQTLSIMINEEDHLAHAGHSRRAAAQEGFQMIDKVGLGAGDSSPSPFTRSLAI